MKSTGLLPYAQQPHLSLSWARSIQSMQLIPVHCTGLVLILYVIAADGSRAETLQ
jgi:hypothetical protein